MEIKSNTSYVKNLKCQDVYTESRVDYTLPDYFGDMRKILFTDASLRPSGKFAGGDEVEFSGVVVYNVVYLDAEGVLCSAEFSSDYDYSVKCSGEKYKDSTSETKISGYAVRLMGPRRISASSSIVGSVRISEEADLSVSGSAFEGDSSPEVNTKTIQIRRTGLSETLEREYAEQVASLDGAIADELSVIYSNAEPRIESVDADEDCVNISGRISIMTVIKNGENPAYSIEKSIPFEENVPFEEANSYIKILPEAIVTSMKSNINATENGCEIVMNIIVEMSAVGEKNNDLSIITDGYLKTAETENRYNDLLFSRVLSCETVKGVHNAEVEKEEIESGSVGEIVFLAASPKIERVEMGENSVNIVGEIKYSGIGIENVDEKTSYVGLKFNSPFVTNVNFDCQNCENARPEVKVIAHGAVASMDSNKIYASCTLETSAVVCAEGSERILSSSAKVDGGDFESVESGVVVYYPDPEDSLFSVAKRFRTSSLKIALDNNISEVVFAGENPEGKLSGVKKLLIY